jgi:ribonucleoside-triphosphate reductase
MLNHVYSKGRRYLSISKGKKSFSQKFQLKHTFIDLYKNQPPNFGFNGLGHLVYRRTYSRIKENGQNEEWYETVQRVVEGTFNMLMLHYENSSIKDSTDIINIEQDAMRMYDKIFNFKFLPPGRGLWSMGSSITENKRIYAALNNCAFVSTKPKNKNDIDEIVRPYTFLMDCGMLGVGIGFDTKVSESGIIIKGVEKGCQNSIVIEDSREGWVESLAIVLKAYLTGDKLPMFDYTKLRPAGTLLKVFGGVSAGAGPLIDLHNDLTILLDTYVGKIIDSRLVVDIMNLIGKSVVAGNISKCIIFIIGRTAEIALGEPNDDKFIELKNYNKYPERANFGWVSNNSIFAELGMDYTKIVDNIVGNGEPGLLWLENMRKYSRLIDPPDFRDRFVSGGNPCLEQSLESYEMCCLAETFPNHHNTLDEYIDTLRYAFMYAKIVTLGSTHWQETNNVMSRNRRIGLSMTGIAQFLNKNGLNSLKHWSCESYSYIKAFDRLLSKHLEVPESIKVTSIKPSGTVSLLGGATPGIHYPHSRFYIRRVRLSNKSELVEDLKRNGYHIEPDVMQPDSTVVVSFPIDIGEGVKTLRNVSIWEQMSLASFMQKYWADNQVSCTVSFKKETESSQVKNALDYFQYQLKGISFLPYSENEKTPYAQMPYEEINEDKYGQMMATIKRIGISKDVKQTGADKSGSNFCDSDTCNVNI